MLFCVKSIHDERKTGNLRILSKFFCFSHGTFLTNRSINFIFAYVLIWNIFSPLICMENNAFPSYSVFELGKSYYCTKFVNSRRAVPEPIFIIVFLNATRQINLQIRFFMTILFLLQVSGSTLDWRLDSGKFTDDRCRF